MPRKVNKATPVQYAQKVLVDYGAYCFMLFGEASTNPLFAAQLERLFSVSETANKKWLKKWITLHKKFPEALALVAHVSTHPEPESEPPSKA
jgi:hypothetical protein